MILNLKSINIKMNGNTIGEIGEKVEKAISFQIVSDLHLETYTDEETEDFSQFVIPSAPVLIMAGDIGHFYRFEQLKRFITDMCRNFDTVIYVLGNHEFYKNKNSNEYFSMNDIVDKIKTISFPNLHILDKKSIIIKDVCFVGCTMWSKCTSIPQFIVRIQDMNTSKYNELHNRDVNYIESMIEYCKINKLKLCVITHHSPSLDYVKAEQRYFDLYGTDLNKLLDSGNVHTWIYGHTHRNIDCVRKNGTRIITNQKGKPKDNLNTFSRTKIINF